MLANDVRADVVFRKWNKTDDVIALFPYIKGDTGGRYCLSYEHVGQHGQADYTGLLIVTTLAKEQEYRTLKQELEQIGYHLNIIKRASRTRIASNQEKED